MYFRFYLFTSPDGVKFMSLKCTKHVTCKPYLLAERLGGTCLQRQDTRHIIAGASRRHCPIKLCQRLAICKLG